MTKTNDPFGARAALRGKHGSVEIHRLDALERRGASLSRLPYAIKVLLEAALRQCDGFQITEDDVDALASWKGDASSAEMPFKPARVIMQDFTGVPAVVYLAALSSATARLGGKPERINPVIPVDLVIDHSVQVDRSGEVNALPFNAQREFERNRERYEFLRWGAQAFDNFRVVPPATGIVHQVNLEYLAQVVQVREQNGTSVAFPDSLVGTDSHTTMINGLGVVGWGVGGIEAEACMLAQPFYMLLPQVVGFRLTAELPEGATATDLVLTVTEMLRRHGVVGKFVEFYGPGLSHLSLADRATIANMAPEYGATMGFFPVDEETLRYLSGTGRSPDLVDLVERYTKEQGLFRRDDAPDPQFSDTLSLDMSSVESSIAGPRRPQDRVPLREGRRSFQEALEKTYGVGGGGAATAVRVEVEVNGRKTALTHGSVVIAAITSCTNTSNPSVMLGAGLLAKKAVERGLQVPPHVKTSLAPGSRVVSRYLDRAELTGALETLGFHVVGYGCTTCIGNSGPLPPPLPEAIQDNDLVVAAVLSGNRNFEGRVSPYTRANYLASPPLVVAYALAGTMDVDLTSDPIGEDEKGEPVYLRDVWPTQKEVSDTLQTCLEPQMFETEYGNVFGGNEEWNKIPVGGGKLYEFDDESTYIREPGFFEDLTLEVPPIQPIQGARCLAFLGDSVTTDHISPAGAIPADGPAGQYLISKGIEPRDFNSFGSRRGNHEVMVRGTFGNIRLRNRLVPGVEGGYTIHHATGEQVSIFEAAERYRREGTQLLILAGKEYGTGSSRDWAAKGTYLQGVKAVIAESYERIHRSNLIGMGVLPLEFLPGESAGSLGLDGRETFDVEGVDESLEPRKELVVRARGQDGEKTFRVVARIDSPVEVEYYRNGGILHTVLRSMLRGSD
ncbi:MAG: aconitate hydratase AcnA [Planctomycetota bacterium]|nr:aconitate hydratase AcnA [Planctomycetota bacterium]